MRGISRIFPPTPVSPLDLPTGDSAVAPPYRSVSTTAKSGAIAPTPRLDEVRPRLEEGIGESLILGALASPPASSHSEPPKRRRGRRQEEDGREASASARELQGDGEAIGGMHGEDKRKRTSHWERRRLACIFSAFQALFVLRVFFRKVQKTI